MPVMQCSNGDWKIGRDGDCRYSSKEDAEDAQAAYYAQKNEGFDDNESDVVSMDHSFLIRVLELMRENKHIDDVKLHQIADRIIELGKHGPVNMDHYDFITKDLEPEEAGYEDDGYGDEEQYEQSDHEKELARIRQIAGI